MDSKTSFCSKLSLEQIEINYENAVSALNSLPYSNSIVTVKRYQKGIEDAPKYLLRAGILLEDLDEISAIHIAGTKGKGSTCALTESILRHHGYRTGLFSSPHILEVRERISINGSPISKQDFTKYFWQIYEMLNEKKKSELDTAQEFTFFVIMALKIFLAEKVDVAIIETGIGGEYDVTNVLRNVPVVGITSLGLDHTNLLGSTIEEIAWHKAGIMKPGSRAYTTPQTESALEVLNKRSVERNCLLLNIVKPLYNLSIHNNNYPKDIFNLNANLAVTLSQAWINHRNKLQNAGALEIDILSSEATKLGLSNFTWCGRYQVIPSNLHTFYLDGAHTRESIQICSEWFNELTHTSSRKRALFFNTTGDRNAKDLLHYLINCKFNKVFFVPNKALSDDTTEDEINRCHEHQAIWIGLNACTETTRVLPSITDAINECPINCNILITGSLYLVGAAMKIIGPGFTKLT